MTKTTNYSLPQWEAHDALKRGDFNEAMESIDAALKTTADTTAAAYSPDNQAVECTAVTLTNYVVGDTICTFPFTPRFVILQGKYTATVVQQGRTTQMLDYYTYTYEYLVNFRLSGTSLILSSRGSDAAISTLVILAFR